MVHTFKANLYDVQIEVAKIRSAIVQTQKREEKYLAFQGTVITQAMDTYISADKTFKETKYTAFVEQQKLIAELEEFLKREKQVLKEIVEKMTQQEEQAKEHAKNLEEQSIVLATMQKSRVVPDIFLEESISAFEIAPRNLQYPKTTFRKNLFQKEVMVSGWSSFVYVNPALQEICSSTSLPIVAQAQEFAVFQTVLMVSDMEIIYQINISESLQPKELLACAQYLTGIGVSEGLLVPGTDRRVAFYYMTEQFELRSAVIFWDTKDGKTGWIFETYDVFVDSAQLKNTFILRLGSLDTQTMQNKAAERFRIESARKKKKHR